MDYHMQFVEYLSLLEKTWNIICNFWNFFPFSKNVDYHMQFLEFLSFFQKRGLLYAISGIYFTSRKAWTFICNLWNFFPFSKKWYIICNLWNSFSFSKNMGYHMQYSELLPRL